MHHRLFRFTMLALVLTASACGTDAAYVTAPQPEGVAGAYHATTLLVTKGDSTIDELAQGIELVLTLAPGGSIAGHFTKLDTEGELARLDLLGSWTQNDSTVTVVDNANAITGFMPLRIVGDQLVGESTTNDITAHLVLSR